jgi:hypothetical protein
VIDTGTRRAKVAVAEILDRLAGFAACRDTSFGDGARAYQTGARR